jgi:hypothetical protein
MKDQKPLRSYVEAAAGDRVEVCLNSGVLNCTVNEAKEDSYHGK